jgi:alkaline phosphatase D
VSQFQELIQQTPTLAIWDDHDFTGNNQGGSAPGKENALAAFQRYWDNPSYGSGGVPGIWSKFTWGDVEFFLLDGRYHRGDNDNTTMLGADQLQWLQTNLVASQASFKVLACGSPWNLHSYVDSWTSFPDEREALLDFIMTNSVDGVFLLSGDIHTCEARRLRDQGPGSYAVYEFTSSGIAQVPAACLPGPFTQDTRLFCDGVVQNYGLLHFDTITTPPSVTNEFYDKDGNLLYAITISLDQLSQ